MVALLRLRSTGHHERGRDEISLSEQVGTFSGKERRLGKRMEEIGEG